MASSTNSGMTEEYPYPCHVNPLGFVSIKLSGKKKYDGWKKQMMCLLESHDLQGFIDGTLKNPKKNGNRDPEKKAENDTNLEAKYKEWKRTDALVQGWIFGSLTEDVVDKVDFGGIQTAYGVWKKLKTTYSDPPPPPPPSTPPPPVAARVPIYLAEYIPLHRAIVRSDWEYAKHIFDTDKDALTAKITVAGSTPLHVAVETCKDIQFVENLLEIMSPESLPNLLSKYKYNALHSAAIGNNTKAAKLLVGKNPRLLFQPESGNYLPIHKALSYSHKDIFRYLFDASKEHIGLCEEDARFESPFAGTQGAFLLTQLIHEGLLDDAYDLIKECPDLARTKDGKNIPMASIARPKQHTFFSRNQYNFYQKFVYYYVPIKNDKFGDEYTATDVENQATYNANFVTKSTRSCFYSVIKWMYVKFWKVALLHVPHIKNLWEDKMKHHKTLMILERICEEVSKISRDSTDHVSNHYCPAIKNAVRNDTPEVIEMIIKYFPLAIWTTDEGYVISQIAILNRCEEVYNFLVNDVSDGVHGLNICYDKKNNNLLHNAGQLAPTHKLNEVSGAALQMQRELQWFKAVEKFILPKDKEDKNDEGETPITTFRKEHNKLRKEGEEWMKKTADSYTITAVLIITIVFAAAITVPGGNNNNGYANFKTKASFIVFVVSDAISLFTSTTSLLLFLSILTARYGEEDFLYMLPKRLIFGLVMLFLSVTSMLVAFSATLYLMFGQGKAWVLIAIASLTCLPIASFVTLQLPLLFELYTSTYHHAIGGKPDDDRKIKQA